VAAVSAVSRKTHGSTPFDINLPLGGTPSIESRNGGVTQIVSLSQLLSASMLRLDTRRQYHLTVEFSRRRSHEYFEQSDTGALCPSVALTLTAAGKVNTI